MNVFPEGASGGGGRRQTKSLAAIVPHPGPCLIDLWTGQVVARNAVVEDVGPVAAPGKSIKVQPEGGAVNTRGLLLPPLQLSRIYVPPSLLVGCSSNYAILRCKRGVCSPKKEHTVVSHGTVDLFWFIP